jgi:hypothetical protein
LTISLYHKIYLGNYLKLKPDLRNEIKLWMPFIAAVQLNEQIEAERESLIEMIKEGLAV